ncbi:DUF6328 family protein, partial [Streptomyces sp. URMC 123]|uniref:DUF6328 family protein n=1 Tax=Streptomyces sp. URMC 123 TaxID=3423403 RepID=UPI003F1AAA44
PQDPPLALTSRRTAVLGAPVALPGLRERVTGPAPGPVRPAQRPAERGGAERAAEQAEAEGPSGPAADRLADRDRTAYAELLQEVRIGQTCVQYLAGFLMALAFTPRFADLTPGQHWLYVTALVVTLVSAALLTAPAPCHRIVYGHRLKSRLLKVLNRLTLTGLALLPAALGCALLLVLDVVGVGAGPCIAVLTVLGFLIVWFGLPLWMRLHHGRRPAATSTTGTTGAMGATTANPDGAPGARRTIAPVDGVAVVHPVDDI